MNWTPFSFIVTHLARQIRTGEITFSGVNSTLPMLACLLAKRAYDFDFTYINVAGGVEPQPVDVPLSSSDPAIVHGSPAIFANQDFYDLCARGGLDLVYLGCAQIDAEGRTNVSAIGSWENPKVRLPGGGGAAVMLPTAKRVVTWRTDHTPRALVDKLDFVTAAGNMTALVTSVLFRTLPDSALTVLRFNFRGVGTSEGAHDFGIGEALDIAAALDSITTECPELPVFVSGWSFGADTSLSVLDSRITAWLACAPPLRVLPLEDLTAAAGSDPRLKLLIIPEHDQFRDPESTLEATASWLNTEVVAIAGADHFFVGRTHKVAALIVATIDTQLAT
jgi:glutaconate CoA-transferase subunit B